MISLNMLWCFMIIDMNSTAYNSISLNFISYENKICLNSCALEYFSVHKIQYQLFISFMIIHLTLFYITIYPQLIIYTYNMIQNIFLSIFCKLRKHTHVCVYLLNEMSVLFNQRLHLWDKDTDVNSQNMRDTQLRTLRYCTYLKCSERRLDFSLHLMDGIQLTNSADF